MVSPHRAALASWCLLLALQPAWYLYWQPPGVVPAGWAALLMSLPLLTALPGLARDRPRAHVWACFIGIFYFMHGIVAAMTYPAARAAALLETVLVLSFFTATVLRLRRRGP